jgi:hypothetical protein
MKLPEGFGVPGISPIRPGHAHGQGFFSRDPKAAETVQLDADALFSICQAVNSRQDGVFEVRHKTFASLIKHIQAVGAVEVEDALYIGNIGVPILQAMGSAILLDFRFAKAGVSWLLPWQSAAGRYPKFRYLPTGCRRPFLQCCLWHRPKE